MKSVCSYFQKNEGRNFFEIPLIINSGKNTLRITRETIEVLPISNHEEADTKLIFHSRMNNEAAGVVAKDTDALLLQIMLHVY